VDERYTTNNANLGTTHGIRICSLVVTITFVIVFFELMPEKTILSIPIKPEEEHNIALPMSCGFSTLLTQKKEQEYKEKQNRRRILIVDDEPDITAAFEKGLMDRGFKQVDTINDPLLALNKFRAGSYDLLIIDIIMPQMDGFGLYEEIRKIDNEVRVCFITAFEVNYQALRDVFPAASTTDDIGCFIRKPIEVGDLIKHIEAELS
jgi:CheY-like chemotaxis protein